MEVNPSRETIELVFVDSSFVQKYQDLCSLFSKKESFQVCTNSFYSRKNNRLYNWGEITDDCRAFLKYLLKPSLHIESRVRDIFVKEYGLDIHQPFICIHIRTGDYNLHHNHLDKNWLSHHGPLIKQCVLTKQCPCVLISDCAIIAKKLVEKIPGLYYWDNKKTHTGDLINHEGSALLDTLCDFFILSKASHIFYTHDSVSGFSMINSILYRIPYQSLVPQDPMRFRRLSFT